MKRFFCTLLMTFLTLSVGACNAAANPSPQALVTTKEVIITKIIERPTSAPIIITATPAPTFTPIPVTPTLSLSHDWHDYGGICMRPDNIPEGIQINPDAVEVEGARTKLLESLWRLIILNESVDRLTPSFASSSTLIQGTLMDVHLRGPFIPVGKLPPSSNSWNFSLEDPTFLWGKIHPGEKFKGIALNTICLEFFLPLEFEKQKRIDSQIHYISLVGGVSHAKFGIEDIFGSPRLNIKLYKSPYGGTRQYQDLLGFASSNTPEQNALAANEHFGALIATLNTVLKGGYDGDGYLEFGYGSKNSDPLPISSFHIVKLFSPKQ